MDDKEPTKEPWSPDWGAIIFTIVIIVISIMVLSNGSDNSGPACDLVRGC